MSKTARSVFGAVVVLASIGLAFYALRQENTGWPIMAFVLAVLLVGAVGGHFVSNSQLGEWASKAKDFLPWKRGP